MKLHLATVGEVNIPCEKVGLEWPPPEWLWFDGNGAREATAEDDRAGCMFQDRMSEITDEQREGMTHVVRGAEYFYPDHYPEHLQAKIAELWDARYGVPGQS